MSNNQQRQGSEGNLLALINQMKPQIAAALPKHCSPDRIARIALTALRANYRLQQCTPASFLGSLLQASQLGLEINTPLGHAYLVPYKDVATLIIGYQGMIDLARRSGMVSSVYAMCVYKGDEFDYQYGLMPHLHHKPCDRPGEITNVYAVARIVGGEPVFVVLRKDEVERYRQRSRAANDGPWVTDYNMMAMKTAVRRLWQWVPKSVEMAQAQVIDESSEREGNQSDHFSDEVAQALSGLPADQRVVDTLGEPAPPPVQNAPEGRRVALPSSRKAQQQAAQQQPANDQKIDLDYGNVELPK